MCDTEKIGVGRPSQRPFKTVKCRKCDWTYYDSRSTHRAQSVKHFFEHFPFPYVVLPAISKGVENPGRSNHVSKMIIEITVHRNIYARDESTCYSLRYSY